jgi:hypothetical protein
MNTIFGPRNLGSVGCTSAGEHGVRPYANVVGANSMFALRSENTSHQVQP